MASSSPGRAFFRKVPNTSPGTNPACLSHARRSSPDVSHSTLVSTGTAMVFRKSSPTLSAMKMGGGRVVMEGCSRNVLWRIYRYVTAKRHIEKLFRSRQSLNRYYCAAVAVPGPQELDLRTTLFRQPSCDNFARQDLRKCRRHEPATQLDKLRRSIITTLASL